MLSYTAAALLAVSVLASEANYFDTTTWKEDSPTCGSGLR